MKFLIQRVLDADVKVKAESIGHIGKGLLVFVGISESDTREIADKMLHKLLNLRIFEDEAGKTNLSLAAVDGSLLIISQFTLYADCRHGNRPSFINAGAPDMAKSLYEYIIARCRETVPDTACGEFGADMQVSLVNEGPFTVILDSEEI
ncbi:MAG: D-aminoacyl-tRNA deacylase [Roseburia sp.]|nr:D-aminoacyl-tRNA deacylase [Ruminococcus sp.]MCM1154550.1 D-aminoacyl-tRNA deacylase [Roseburia sp.]MCM1243335.1 D-aminoacyl-tRNA deacylase [Roseburia sp.]